MVYIFTKYDWYHGFGQLGDPARVAYFASLSLLVETSMNFGTYSETSS